jgi:polygalacturonase
MSLTKVSYSMITGTPVNVLDYGADPTNTSDSTAAIVAATTYANANNKSVYFPAGSYKYVPTAPLECSSFIGESAGSTAIYANCASYSGVVFRNTGGLWANLTIRETNLIRTSGILYQLSASTALNAIGGAASFTAYAKSSRVWVLGGQYALDIGNMFTCEFDHCRFNQAGHHLVA